MVYRGCLALVLLVTAAASTPARAAIAPIPIRVVVVTTFEPGADTGDIPGEFQYWVERLPLPDTLPFPQAYRHLRYNAAKGVLGIVTGEGAERGAASIMALGSDPRFDLSKSYWVVAGIAGVDPNVASVGSAAWANWVVNADLAFEVDARDMPAAWSTGIVPFDRAAPFASPAPEADSMHGVEAYRLNSGLVEWAYRSSAAVPLADDPNLARLRAPYAKFPNAMRPPFVLQGDSLCGDRYWIGASMNSWAERWVSYWTGGRGSFAMTAEEDAGILQSLTFLAAAARGDGRRVLVLRTASDYAAPGAGGTAESLLAHDAELGGESAYREALEAAYRVGSPVVDELSSHWSRYAYRIPGMP
ncbi:MAG: purine nucleoside permease [Candidatus Eremiobacteraeota bacterium]|nr:purine nucleoside permease [Candidatus Eremiobacteraeota bacterium]